MISCFDSYFVRHLTLLDLNVGQPSASHKVRYEVLVNANNKMTAIIGRLFLMYADKHFIFFVGQEFWFPIPGRTGATHRRSSTVSSKRVILGYAILIKVQRDANYSVYFLPTWPGPDLATLEGSSLTDIMTCTGGCGYSF